MRGSARTGGRRAVERPGGRRASPRSQRSPPEDSWCKKPQRRKSAGTGPGTPPRFPPLGDRPRICRSAGRCSPRRSFGFPVQREYPAGQSCCNAVHRRRSSNPDACEIPPCRSLRLRITLAAGLVALGDQILPAAGIGLFIALAHGGHAAAVGIVKLVGTCIENIGSFSV